MADVIRETKIYLDEENGDVETLLDILDLAKENPETSEDTLKLIEKFIENLREQLEELV